MQSYAETGRAVWGRIVNPDGFDPAPSASREAMQANLGGDVTGRVKTYQGTIRVQLLCFPPDTYPLATLRNPVQHHGEHKQNPPASSVLLRTRLHSHQLGERLGSDSGYGERGVLSTVPGTGWK